MKRVRTRIGLAIVSALTSIGSFGLAAVMSQGTAGASAIHPSPNVVQCSPSGCLPGGGTISTIIGKGGAG